MAHIPTEQEDVDAYEVIVEGTDFAEIPFIDMQYLNSENFELSFAPVPNIGKIKLRAMRGRYQERRQAVGPQVFVMKNVLQEHAIDAATSIRDVLQTPLPFQIPCMNPVCSPPFVYGKAEYEHAIDAWTTHGIPSTSSAMSVCGMDGNWLYIIRCVIDNTIVSVDQHHDSSKAKLRPDGVITVNNAVVGIVESKASESDLETAGSELISKLHEAGHCRFPVGCSSIVGFTTCASMVRIHLIQYTGVKPGNILLYSQNVLKTYRMENVGGRSDFIVDLFKLMRWMVHVESSDVLTHLTPGVKTLTRNGNFIFWGNAGLVKTFSRFVRLDLMQDVYDLKHLNLEQGRRNGNSVTITSIGSTFQNAVISQRVTSQNQVISQIQSALCAIHGVGIAHCDICLDNIFVLNDGTIILGDFEYCTEVGNQPPEVRRLYNNSEGRPPQTALDLDENQFAKLREALSEGFNLPMDI